jgi:hypothetical protein
VSKKEVSDNKSVRLMLAYLCTATEAGVSLVRKVQILDRFDLTDQEIARVCDSSIQSVRNARSMAKRKRKKAK